MKPLVIRSWRKKSWWRALMFAMPMAYFYVGASLTGVEGLKLTGSALIVIGVWLSVKAHGRALDRMYTYVATRDVAQVQFDCIIAAFCDTPGLVWVHSAQERGDPFFPRRAVVVVEVGDKKKVVLYDWIKNRYYEPHKFRSKRFATLEGLLAQT